ncbi:MAG: RNA polymerase sigma-70 factor [Mucilaginibacter sp.]|nr:RNA polymerase sigma-70 factor [Mucilaginibacter sp.]
MYKRHVTGLLSIAYQKTGDKETAEELTQEAFIKLYQHKAHISAETSVKAYLYVTLKNSIINKYRQQMQQQRFQEYTIARQLAQEPSPLAYVETRELEQQLKKAIESLPPQCKMVLKLSREQYLSDKEIAATMEISINTVEQHKRKALRLLRGALGNLFEAGILLYLINR